MKFSFIFAFIFFGFTLAANANVSANDTWISVQTPDNSLATQKEAGYDNGCAITALFYALKLGPALWKTAYTALPGSNDVQKIQSLAKKFEMLPSKDSPGASAFSEAYGTDPNDLPWMIPILTGDTQPLKNESLIILSKTPDPDANKIQLLQGLAGTLKLNLSRGIPVIMNLLFATPGSEFAHAVLIVGVEEAPVKTQIAIQVIDPETGKRSFGLLGQSWVGIPGAPMAGLSFSDKAVIDQAGAVVSVILPTNSDLDLSKTLQNILISAGKIPDFTVQNADCIIQMPPEKGGAVYIASSEEMEIMNNQTSGIDKFLNTVIEAGETVVAKASNKLPACQIPGTTLLPTVTIVDGGQTIQSGPQRSMHFIISGTIAP